MPPPLQQSEGCVQRRDAEDLPYTPGAVLLEPLSSAAGDAANSSSDNGDDGWSKPALSWDSDEDELVFASDEHTAGEMEEAEAEAAWRAERATRMQGPAAASEPADGVGKHVRQLIDACTQRKVEDSMCPGRPEARQLGPACQSRRVVVGFTVVVGIVVSVSVAAARGTLDDDTTMYAYACVAPIPSMLCRCK